MDDRVASFVGHVAERLSAEPDLDDFLGWTAGTLEYWVHIVAASVARRQGWASRTEVPYITGCPSPTAKSDTKWADGAMILADGVGVLLEVKTIPYRESLGLTIRKVPTDLAALASADWARTLAQPLDRYAGAEWADRRATMRAVLGLQLCLVHGAIDDEQAVDAAVDEGLRSGLATLEHRYRDQEQPDWLPKVQTALTGPSGPHEISGDEYQGVLYGWTVEIVSG